ncbi:MAG: NAD-dependent epimerase/dehydratase family protein [Lentisphaerae bacterium]|nr:NAD-dependent epimerase/dehydratase family protein [Lentisphaerota bacterium]
MRALITGGGGFLGQNLARRLLARGDQVRILARNTYPELARRGAECMQGDIRDADACLWACTDVDVVFHAAAMAGVWGPRQRFFEINVKGTANVLRACLENKVRTLVHTSSPSVVFGRDSIAGGDESLAFPEHYLAAYPESKAVAERMVLDADGWEMVPNRPADYRPDHSEADVQHLRTCALRPHLIWGPGDPHLLPRVIAAARAGRLPIVGDGRNQVDITYIDNAVEAHLLAAEALRTSGAGAGKAYFIGDDEPVVLWDWLQEILRRLGEKPLRRRLPYWLAMGLAGGMEAVHTLIPALGEPRLTRFTVAQLGRSHWFSHRRAAADFGYRAVVGPEEGLQRLVDWLRSAHPA